MCTVLARKDGKNLVGLALVGSFELHLHSSLRIDQTSASFDQSKPPPNNKPSKKMVKFGNHHQFFVEQKNPDSYTVPYNEVKIRIEEGRVPLDEFVVQWRTCLEHAKSEFDMALMPLWQRVFAALHSNEDSRGAPPEKALLLFTQQAAKEHVQEVLEQFKNLQATALLNAEALRKLAKKFDKNYRPNNKQQPVDSASESQPAINSLSARLLPELYSANFVLGLTVLQQGTDLLRRELGVGDYGHVSTESATDSSDPERSEQLDSSYHADNHHQFTMLSKHHRQDSHAEHDRLVTKKRQELVWLRDSVKRIDQLGSLHKLVAHRGFHSPQDRSDRRPMENSLQAYESAWTSGIHLCECDIAMTKDEILILAHDEDFSRLALDSNLEESHRKVQDLTLREIMSVALKSGVRPPLLLDVLQAAHAIGGQSQLIVEIKPGNREAASALARLLGQYPYLMANCAVIMSFDIFVMHSLHEEMDAWFGPGDQNGEIGTHRRSYSMGIFPSPMELSQLQKPTSQRRPQQYPRPKLFVLTVCDVPTREVYSRVSISEEEEAFTKIHGWLKGRLDGVYMQFEPQMLTPEGLRMLRKLTRRYHVGVRLSYIRRQGFACVEACPTSQKFCNCFSLLHASQVWGHNGRDPDDYLTFSRLVQEAKASFVNSDLPRDFFQHHDKIS
jgi:Glycerophosphoryl diester phosphodiesterase family